MTDQQRREAARLFAQKWKGKGKEDEDDRSYWIDILERILGVENVTDYIDFQKKVIVDGNTKRIDAYIPETKVLIEQKSLGLALDKPGLQSGGDKLTPYEQAKRYNDNLPYDEKARWIVTSNFEEIWIYDMNARVPEALILKLDNLQSEHNLLKFLVQEKNAKIKREEKISKDAGVLVKKLYKAFKERYKDCENKETLQSLNALCVRLVFCLYAEDAGIFGDRDMFHEYMESAPVEKMRTALIELFHVLDTKESDRDPYLESALSAFPYINGGLFSDDKMEIPGFTEEIRNLLLVEGCGIDWTGISPTIFGALFESILEDDERHEGGMHYTSIENIHKVIDPLFLDDLINEFAEIKEISVTKTLNERLNNFQKKLASLIFMDPACGSGNFLTESYLSLRRLENEVLKLKTAANSKQVTGQIIFDGLGSDNNPIKVSIHQFYGIEINDYAVNVARTALWIAEHQMMRETMDVVHSTIEYLPLKSYTNIVEGNALRMDWNDVVPKENVDFIIGNPPFMGYSNQTGEQKEDILSVYTDETGKPYKSAGKIDYVAGWYFKACQFMDMSFRDKIVCSCRRLPSEESHGEPETATKSGDSSHTAYAVVRNDKKSYVIPSECEESHQGSVTKNIRCAFVSTNSITQGEQVAAVWKPLYERFGVDIDFAHRSFVWDSEAADKAHVHVVIVGFSVGGGTPDKMIYENNEPHPATIINPYLIDAPTVFIESRKKPLCEVPEMVYGNKPTDGGFLFLTKEQYEEAVLKESDIQKHIKKILGSEEYINNKERYCFWLVNSDPSEMKKSKIITERINAVKEFRLSSPKEATRKSASTPFLFQEVRQPNTEYIIVPRVSSERRRYVPIGFMQPDIIVNDSVQIIPNADLYHFGILTSNIHMAWMRAVCGRLKSDYRYSKDIVYNNFPWPTPTDAQKSEIEKTAQAILDARALYPDSSLADLYDPLTMPPELQKAHTENDKAVMKAYGFNIKTMSEADCVAELMRMYQELTDKKK